MNGIAMQRTLNLEQYPKKVAKTEKLYLKHKTITVNLHVFLLKSRQSDTKLRAALPDRTFKNNREKGKTPRDILQVNMFLLRWQCVN